MFTNDYAGKKRKRRERIAAMLFVLPLLILVLLFIFGSLEGERKRQLQPPKSPSEDSKAGLLTTLPPSRESEGSARRRQGDTFTVSINPELYVNEKGEAYAYIKNKRENGCDMQVFIYDTEGALLYDSGRLAPGESADRIKLSTKPRPGSHAAEAEFCAVDSETGGLLQKVGVRIRLTVSA